ncbi:PA14 domain-containing protein [Actinoplanes sp. NPDC049681]|uniref:PA14 domain-containing protein n=1 Tax=Actinoplanes sp. NPDC049681 TaxID=3363905 RepID=UPI0037966F0C
MNGWSTLEGAAWSDCSPSPCSPPARRSLSTRPPRTPTTCRRKEPGVTLRTYDTRVPLTRICTLKPGQTPNVGKLVPAVDLRTAEDFAFEDNFVAHVLGNLTVPADGSYTFRLTSDDGSRLTIDGTTAIDNDGLHGVESADGTVALTAGHHSVFIEYFEAGGGQRLTLSWRPPGAEDFAVVPSSSTRSRCRPGPSPISARGTRSSSGGTRPARRTGDPRWMSRSSP